MKAWLNSIINIMNALTENKKMMKYRPIPVLITLLILISSGSSLFAQGKQYTEEVTVVAPYIPSISDANKINFSPTVQDTTMPKPDFTYGIKSTIIPTSYAPDAIEPAKMAGEPISKLYDNYLKAGFGNYSSPLFELYHNNSRSKDMNYGFSLHHFSSAGKIKDYGFPGFSNDDIKVFGRKNWDKKSTLNASLGFNRQVFHYYGYKEAQFHTLPTKDETKQRYALFNANVGWKTAETDSSKVSNDLNFKFYHLNDLFKTKETSFSLEDKIGQNVKWLSISPTQKWEIEGGFDYHTRKTDPLESQNTWVLGIKPQFSAELGGLNVNIGLNTQIVHDTSTDLHLYPMIEVKGMLIPEVLSFYAGIDGTMKEYSEYDLITANPFVSHIVKSSFANVTYHFYGGIRARFFEQADLRLEVNQSHIDDMPFFITDYSVVYANKFIAVYDKADLLKVKADVGYHFEKKLEIRDALEWAHFITNMEKPWHVPELINTLSIKYNIQEKIMLNVEFIYYGKMYAPAKPVGTETIGKAISLDARPDLNLGVEYKYSRLIGAFLNVNNILNKNYPLWYNYPSKGINVLAGLSFSF